MATNEIFVFGSDLGGRHLVGAALHAWKRQGARRGVGEGPMGLSYALPTRDGELRTLPLDMIRRHVRKFIEHAERQRGSLIFNVRSIGIDLAGYTHAEMAPLFVNAPSNCLLPSEWLPYIEVMHTCAGETPKSRRGR